jgi:predicted DNA-binding transcriptional regulator AlpA
MIADFLPNHERLNTLPPEEIPALLAQLAAIQSILAARLVATPISAAAPSSHQPEESNQLLTAEDAAKILRVTPRWLYRHANRLPFTRRLSRKCLRFSEAGLRRWAETRRKTF